MKYPVLERDVKLSESRRDFFESVAEQYENPGPFKRYYNSRLKKLVGFNVPKGATVLELGCGLGDLLASLAPSRGVGVDFSAGILARARCRHPELEFIQADVHELVLNETFEFVLISNLMGDLVDIQRVLGLLETVCNEKTRIIITDFNYLWSPLVKVAELLKIKPRAREQNWLELQDLKNLLALSDFETVKTGRDMLCPVNIPGVAMLFNDILGSFPGISRFAVNELVVARPRRARPKKDYKVSVIVA
ncbi:MAG: methyltransferase domain-containing protein, partial [Deltaproteobacteria bacterium]|nr:methyltransferase domain-containing protein [Deltaproteobacteria bacterium]